MECFIDNRTLSNYSYLRNQKYATEFGAQHRTLRGRKHIYKNMLTTFMATLGVYKISAYNMQTENLFLGLHILVSS